MGLCGSVMRDDRTIFSLLIASAVVGATLAMFLNCVDISPAVFSLNAVHELSIELSGPL